MPVRLTGSLKGEIIKTKPLIRIFVHDKGCAQSLIGLLLQRECIARIDPETGRVVGWINMIGLTADAFDKAKGQVSLPVFRWFA